MLVIDIIYMLFIALSLYFTILFLLIFFDQRKELLKDNLPKHWPSLTVLIPIHNKARDIAECIRLIKAADYPKNKLIIIAMDDQSTDNSLNILKKIKGIKIISNAKNMGKALTINKGLKLVKSDLVAVIDGDAFIDKNALKLIVGKIIENDKIGAVTCAITTKGTENFLQRLQDIEYTIIVWVRKLLQSIDSIYVTPGPLALYRTSVLKEIGGFDHKNITEDIEIAWRVMYYGYKVRMALGAKVLVDSHKSFKKWWRQRQRWSMGGIQTLMKYKHTLFKKKYGMLGKFVGPFFLLSIFVSLSGFVVFSYTMGLTLIKILYAFLAPNKMFQYYKDIFMLPSVFLYFGIIIFILSLAYVYFGLHTMNNKKYLSFKRLRIIDLLAYLTIYVTIFPVILLIAMYRLCVGDMSWY
jgi:poly-beta-1,6-N-acetyl-D-glucosamine synthase